MSGIPIQECVTAGEIKDLPDNVRYYLKQIEKLLTKLENEERVKDLLSLQLAPNMLDLRTQLAVAIGFAGRALLPPTGQNAPDIPENPDLVLLKQFASEISIWSRTSPSKI